MEKGSFAVEAATAAIRLK